MQKQKKLRKKKKPSKKIDSVAEITNKSMASLFSENNNHDKANHEDNPSPTVSKIENNQQNASSTSEKPDVVLSVGPVSHPTNHDGQLSTSSADFISHTAENHNTALEYPNQDYSSAQPLLSNNRTSENTEHNKSLVLKTYTDIADEDISKNNQCLSYADKFIDGIATGTLSFSKALITIQNFTDVTAFKPTDNIVALTSTIFITTIGKFIANKENKNLTKNIDNNIYFSDNIKENPLLLILIVLGSGTHGIIFFSSLNYSIGQIGYELKKSSPLFDASFLCALTIFSAQFINSNGKKLLERLREGDKIYDYNKNSHSLFSNLSKSIIVNFPPVLSSTITGLLGAVATYQIVLNKFELNNANKELAFVPAVGFGLISGGLNYLLVGVPFKKYLSYKVLQCGTETAAIRNEQRCTHPSISFYNLIKTLLLASSAMAIGFGTLDESVYTLIYKEPYPMSSFNHGHLEDYHNHLAMKSIIFGFCALSFGAERLIDFIAKDTDEDQILTKEIVSNGKYTLYKLGNDIVTISLATSLKLLLDLKFFPSNNMNDWNEWYSRIIFGICGLATSGIQLTCYPKEYLAKDLAVNNLRLLCNDSDKSTDQNENNQKFEQFALSMHPASSCQKISAWFFRGAIATCIASLPEVLLEKISSTPKDSNTNFNANHFIGAVTGSMLMVSIYRNWNHVDLYIRKKSSKLATNVCSFFNCRKSRNQPILEEPVDDLFYEQLPHKLSHS